MTKRDALLEFAQTTWVFVPIWATLHDAASDPPVNWRVAIHAARRGADGVVHRLALGWLA